MTPSRYCVAIVLCRPPHPSRLLLKNEICSDLHETIQEPKFSPTCNGHRKLSKNRNLLRPATPTQSFLLVPGVTIQEPLNQNLLVYVLVPHRNSYPTVLVRHTVLLISFPKIFTFLQHIRLSRVPRPTTLLFFARGAHCALLVFGSHLPIYCFCNLALLFSKIIIHTELWSL